ncbi:Peptidase S1 and S6 chymotrypsin/Hap [uncultured spirochete]|uniref:Peptidase S1 and S6 chymotrypsin/Hap n=1 Tax=uncultured spirochete TaxID=156406 RepID=A0A3P3XTU3_9SPIR|nr:Peptidase S1 and S6 chymotrypsin/Hap [uncultured spirochete]
MKLYSKTQVGIAVAISVALTALSIAGIIFIFNKPMKSQSPSNFASPIETSHNGTTDNFEPSGQTGINQTLSAESIPVTNVSQYPGGYSSEEAENISIYEKYNESVVNITTEVLSINWFLDPVPQSGGSGSGSIIDEQGYILTNNHVVDKAYKLYVSLSDGSRYEAKLVGADSESDLAVIKFAPEAGKKLKPIPFGTAKNLKVGQKVLAIGNPFGLERTLTTGIISGLGRPIQESNTTILQNMIQTDASINPGNSGGPLFNTRGEMIGINTMIYSPSGGSVGIGFAIPVDTAIRIVPQLIKNGQVRRGWIDMQAIQLFPDLIDYLKQSGKGAPVDSGLLVSTITSGSNAERAGLRGGTTAVRYGSTVFYIGGDIIVSIDNKPVTSIAQLYSALEDTTPGQQVTVEFYRGSKKMSANITLSERKK